MADNTNNYNIGKYFQHFLQEQAARKVIDGGSEVRTIFDEIPYSTLQHMVVKLYLEDFYAFCKKLGGGTAEVMCSLLRARADEITINITLNSFGTVYNEVMQPLMKMWNMVAQCTNS